MPVVNPGYSSLLFLSGPKGREREGRNLCPVQPDPPWGCPTPAPRSCLLGGKHLALLSHLHKVIRGICGRAANVSVSALHTRLLFLSCFLILCKGTWSYLLGGAFSGTRRLFLRPPVVCECPLWAVDTCIAVKEIKIQRWKVIVAPTVLCLHSVSGGGKYSAIMEIDVLCLQ